ncbi:MAG: iron-containing alcohol dehydrogenase [Planctomycetes bacterium]|nr:iron-containing alcohol dehydrogenase [Planctomycetota bacterium]
MTTQFQIPSKIILGGGSCQLLADEVKRLRAHRVLFVTDEFLVRSGVADHHAKRLIEAGLDVCVFSDVQPDPTVKNVMDGLAILRAKKCDIVIGFGGGSPMDAAKAIAVLATNSPPLSQYAGYHRIPLNGLPLILVPTTAGTGSEATRVTIITDTDRNVKMMILDNHLLASVSIVDFELSLTMPASLTAHVGVDTLTHGIEAFVSRKAGPLTDPIALSCISLTAKHLEAAFRDSGKREAREAMMTAACQGGMAFSNSSVALVHGMSRPIGAHFHVPHGLSNAVLLPEVTRFSLSGNLSRYADVARTMNVVSSDVSDEKAGEALLSCLVSLNERLGIGRLRDVVGVSREQFESTLNEMAEAALESGSPQNNPRVPSHEQIVNLYREAW